MKRQDREKYGGERRRERDIKAGKGGENSKKKEVTMMTSVPKSKIRIKKCLLNQSYDLIHSNFSGISGTESLQQGLKKGAKDEH